MKPVKPPPPLDTDEEISALIETLHSTGRRLEELTAGEVDAVADHDGRTFLLRHVQEQLRHNEAARQASILDALPAHIALLDSQGRIVSVNQAWQRFADANGLPCAEYGIGANYLDACDSARGEDAATAQQAAAGIRALRNGEANHFSMEYPCHSPTRQRWFLMTASPLSDERPTGVVVMHLDITERKQAEKALEESKNLLQLVLENVPSHIFWKDRELRFLGCNAQFAKDAGYSRPDELTGKTDFDMAWKEQAESYRADDREVLESGTAKLNIIEPQTTPDGDTIWLRTSKLPLRDKDDGIIGILGVYEDITEQKQAEADLRESEQRFRDIAENIRDAFFLLDADGTHMLYVSPAYEEIWGRSCASLYADPESWTEAIHPDDRAATYETYKNALAVGNAVFPVLQFRILRPDGTLRWVEVQGFPVRDAAGLLVRIAGLAKDITERKQAALELRESERRFSDLLENIELVSIMLDREARITYCNDFLLRLTGWQREEAIGRNWFELFIPPELDDLKGSVFTALLSNLPDTWHHENEILTRSGERRLIRWSNSVLRSGDGEVIGTASIGEDITEQKRTEQALAKLQRQSELILESLEEGIQGIDLEGNIRFQNPAAAKLLGYSIDELFGKPSHATLHHSKADGTPYPIALCPIHISLVDGVVRKIEDDVFWRKDGTSLQIEYTTAPIRDEHGAIVGGVVAFRDVTQRKQREQEVLATKKQLQAILDAIPDLLFEVGLDGRFYTCHSPRVDLLAAPPEEFLGKTVAEVLPAEAAEIILSALREADATGHSAGKQFELALPQGRLQFEISVSRMAVAAGQEARFICLSRDITERKRAELELRESERVTTESRADAAAVRDIAARLQAILDTVVDGVITIDEMGKVETFNPAAEGIFGYAADEVVGRNVSMLMPEPYHGDHDGYLARYRATGEAHIIGTRREVMGRRKDGGTFPLDLSISEMTLAGGRHYTGVVRDITEHKAAEQAVVDARIEAERANAAKNTFLANMSHEIRTPMNGVIGMIEVLQQSSLSGPQMEMANIIRDSSFALLDVINDILDFSKIEAGKLEIDEIPMSVADVVEKACGILDRMALKKKVELTLFTDPAIPEEVMGDPGRLRQILINLTNNAIKFSSATTRPGRVSVRALLVDSDAEDARLEFQVADNGIGLDADSLARIFSPFVQADISTTREYGGTGLGLAISRQLAEMMGGDIRVKSEPDKGSLFSVNLPLVLPPGQTEQTGQTDAQRHPGLLAGLSCLVVGYPDGMTGDLAAYLAHDEAVVEWTADPETARQWIASRPSGRAIVVIETRVASPPLDELRAMALAHPESDIHFVVIRRGLRRGLREEDSHLVSVDGNILTRRTLLDAVAIAAGLAQAPGREALSNAAKAPLAALSGETVRRRGGRILVAEDNEINQSVILHQLALLGYVADLADDGREALTRWREGHHALLLTDLHMPEMDGYELTAAIRRAEGNGQHLPIVALTANALKSEEIRCKAAGMDDYLTKPVLLDRLQAMLEKWLPIPDSDASADPSPAPPADPRLAVLDRSVLPKQIGDDPALIARFFEDYRRSAQETADEIRAAIIQGDWKKAGDGGHKLKSSSRAVGALALGEVCAQLEQAGTDGDANAMLALALEFEHALAAALGAMTREGAASANVLLVDDEAFQLQMLARQLAILGLDRVAACASGQEALNRLDAPSDGEQLIFLDLNMPGMDGVEFIRRLVERRYAGALVLVSGEDARILETAVLLARAHHLNVLGHLNKPVQFERLEALLDSWHGTAPQAAGKAARRYGAEEVRRAISGGELMNYYQPKVDVVSGALTGVETLVRWQHPDDGLVLPDDFIGVAEESGLIDDLTRAVLAEALGQTRRWLDQGLKLRVAVNVSMHNLARLEFADFVLGEVARSGVAAEDLILEVTESRLMTDVLAPLDILTRLRLKHIGLSIDDFGTGHSSLSQLRDIPFDELKIDRSFVHGAGLDKTRGAIFAASLGMARQLGMKSVAEGVEDRADWDFLRQHGCDLAQGYFIARPMPADRLSAWLADWETRRTELVLA